MYAERKGIALQNVEVRLSHQRIHAKDCEDCETKEGMLDEIRSEIHLEGDLDEAQRKRLIEIAARCPVHRTLSSEIKIRTVEI
jgi:putative redox protein